MCVSIEVIHRFVCAPSHVFIISCTPCLPSSLLLFWSGTCLKEVSTDLLVWLTLAVYIGIRVVANMIDYVPDSVALLEKTNVGILGGFLSFFLVLFVNQTNARFLEMYGFSKACVSLVFGLVLFISCVHKLFTHILCTPKSGRIQDVAGLARTQLPKDMADKLVRHFNAAQIAGYVGLNAIG